MDSRKRVDMTSGEFAWTAFSILGLGVLAGWALFGEHRLIESVLDAGNAAEWVAGIGAWVIGFGALKWARIAHEHAKAEAAERVRAAADRIRVQHLDLAHRLGHAASVFAMFEDLPQARLDNPTQNDWKILLDQCLFRVKNAVWTQADRDSLDPEVAALFATFTSRYAGFARACEILAPALIDGSKPLTAGMNAGLDLIAERSHEADVAFNTLCDAVPGL